MTVPDDKYDRRYLAHRCAVAIGNCDEDSWWLGTVADRVYRSIQVHVRKRNGDLAGVYGMFNYRFLLSLEDGSAIHENGKPLNLEEFIYECCNDALNQYKYHWEEEE